MLVSEASNQELIRGETCPRLFSVLLFGNMIAKDEKYIWSAKSNIQATSSEVKSVLNSKLIDDTANAGLTQSSEKKSE